MRIPRKSNFDRETKAKHILFITPLGLHRGVLHVTVPNSPRYFSGSLASGGARGPSPEQFRYFHTLCLSWISVDTNLGGEIHPPNLLDSNSIGASFPAKFAGDFVVSSTVRVQSSASSGENDHILLLGLVLWKKEMRSKDKKLCVNETIQLLSDAFP